MQQHDARTNPSAAKAASAAPAAKDTENIVKANREALYVTANNLLKFNGQYKLAVKVLSSDKTKVIALLLQHRSKPFMNVKIANIYSLRKITLNAAQNAGAA